MVLAKVHAHEPRSSFIMSDFGKDQEDNSLFRKTLCEKEASENMRYECENCLYACMLFCDWLSD